MSKFMDRDFLLDTETGRKLFHDHADDLPILDYHCHLSPGKSPKIGRFPI